MADFGTVLTVAQSLFAALECSILKNIFLKSSYKSEVEELKLTVSTITKVLLDAEAKQEFSNEGQDWIEKLKHAVYDADDLFDEFLTLARRKQQYAGGKLFEEVCDFFSSHNQFSVTYTVSQRIKKIRKKLDAFADNHRKFGFVVDSQPIRRRAESCSYAYLGDVIGREEDQKAVIHMLLDSDVRDDLGYLTIVGVGGLGKTTLAQLVYHDKRVKHEFPLRLWVCVADQDHFDVKTILAKILESATSKKHYDLGMDLLLSELQEELGGKKYLLVLDEVWNEDRYKWLDLRNILLLGARGSKVVVTTRSRITASIIGGEHSIYELQGLSKANSWRLFEMAAFGMRHNQDYPCELVEIGEKIVENCHNAPLAIKVVGSLLFGQDIRKWRSFQESGLAKIKKGDNEIISILKLSYHNLESPLKTCFRYCALFPKNYVICKRKLISLWMAQQYIVPLDGGQNIEDAGEEYFSILLQRCFFQEVDKDEYGEVYSCKIHDLMHDVAQDVAGKEIYMVNSITSNRADNSRHFFHVGNTCAKSFSKLKVRTYLRDGYNLFQVSTLLSSWKLLRVLDLHDLNIKSLPVSIGTLLHLRYLDLSENKNLTTLPNSITKLYNLQTLILSKCFMLRVLPQDLSNLLNLRCLLMDGCSCLLHMPPSMGMLTSLHMLSKFVVDNEKQCVGQLEDLKALKNLSDSIDISILSSKADVKENDRGGYLRSLEHLKELSVTFKGFISPGDHRNVLNLQRSLLKDLQPHPNLRAFKLTGFLGTDIPRWGREWTTKLPNLVKISLVGCHVLQILPSLSKLQHLKSLELLCLWNLEYIENSCTSSDNAAVSAPGSRITELTFFPSLKFLEICDLPKLQGWWRVEDLAPNQPINSSNSSQPSFSHLSILSIEKCPNLVSFPPCSSVEQLCLTGLSRELQIKMGEDDIGIISSSSTSTPLLQPDTGSSHPKLRHVALDNMDYFKLIPVERLTSMSIKNALELESLSEVGELFKCCSSLRKLTIQFCFKLKSLSRGLEYLTALESLSIHAAPMACSYKEDDDGFPWRSLDQTLHFLELSSIIHLENLPTGLQYLTSLRHLKFVHCNSLKEIPEWISCLSSLQSLSIIGCYDLKSLPNALKLLSLQRLEIEQCSTLLSKRCRNPKGDDWPKIKHIPSISISG